MGIQFIERFTINNDKGLTIFEDQKHSFFYWWSTANTDTAENMIRSWVVTKQDTNYYQIAIKPYGRTAMAKHTNVLR